MPKAGALPPRILQDGGRNHRAAIGGREHAANLVAGVTGDDELDAVVQEVVSQLLRLDFALERQDAVLFDEIAPANDLAGFHRQHVAINRGLEEHARDFLQRQQHVTRLIADEGRSQRAADHDEDAFRAEEHHRVMRHQRDGHDEHHQADKQGNCCYNGNLKSLHTFPREPLRMARREIAEGHRAPHPAKP